MGDAPEYARRKARKVQAGQGKQLIAIGGGLYVHPLWAKWFRINTPTSTVRTAR